MPTKLSVRELYERRESIDYIGNEILSRSRQKISRILLIQERAGKVPTDGMKGLTYFITAMMQEAGLSLHDISQALQKVEPTESLGKVDKEDKALEELTPAVDSPVAKKVKAKKPITLKARQKILGKLEFPDTEAECLEDFDDVDELKAELQVLSKAQLKSLGFEANTLYTLNELISLIYGED